MISSSALSSIYDRVSIASNMSCPLTTSRVTMITDNLASQAHGHSSIVPSQHPIISCIASCSSSASAAAAKSLSVSVAHSGGCFDSPLIISKSRFSVPRPSPVPQPFTASLPLSMHGETDLPATTLHALTSIKLQGQHPQPVEQPTMVGTQPFITQTRDVEPMETDAVVPRDITRDVSRGTALDSVAPKQQGAELIATIIQGGGFQLSQAADFTDVKVRDPVRGGLLSLNDAVNQGLVDMATGDFRHPLTNQMIPYTEAMQRGITALPICKETFVNNYKK